MAASEADGPRQPDLIVQGLSVRVAAVCRAAAGVVPDGMGPGGRDIQVLARPAGVKPGTAKAIAVAGAGIGERYPPDVFEPTLNEGLSLLRRLDLPLDHRGDGIFCVAKKTGPVKDRWPHGMYV